MIRYTEGDLFAGGFPALAHGVNCQGVMGAGIAVQFRQRYPQMYEAYRKRCLRGHMFPGDVLSWQHENGFVFNLATQYEPGASAQPWMITAAAGQMIQEACYVFKVTEIAMPLIGCGIGGLFPDQLRAALLPYQHAPVDLVVVALPGLTGQGRQG